MGLGIQTDQPGCHLLAEVSKGHIDLAVIRDGSVVTSRRVPGHENRLVGLVSGESLRSLDPDDELEIRDHGVYLYGWAAAGYAADSLSAIGLPLAAPIPRGPTVLIGACLMAEEVLSWLRAEQ